MGPNTNKLCGRQKLTTLEEIQSRKLTPVEHAEGLCERFRMRARQPVPLNHGIGFWIECKVDEKTGEVKSSERIAAPPQSKEYVRFGLHPGPSDASKMPDAFEPLDITITSGTGGNCGGPQNGGGAGFSGAQWGRMA